MHKTSIKIEIADNDQSRSFGLMFRKSMPDDQGMLFKFSKPQILSFWGRNTYIPLDIAFISDNKEIINIGEIDVFSENPICSKLPAIYAVEVNRGFFKKNSISAGDKIEIDGQSLRFVNSGI